MKDPFVQEIRTFRMEHTEQFKSDIHMICEDLRRLESSLGDRVVTLKPRRIQPEKSRRLQ